MAKIAARLILVICFILIIAVVLLWTPDTDKDDMIAKYGQGASAFVTDASGMAIHYRDEGKRGGPPIILLHGSGGSLHNWADMVAHLSETYRLISFDLPGHGLTGPNPERDYSAASYFDAIETVMAATDIEQAVIAGNSMGGWAAWRFALAAPERVTGLILIDASGPQITEKSRPYLAARIVNSPIGKMVGQKITPRAIVEKTLPNVIYDHSQITDELVDRYWELARFPGNRKAMIDRSKTDRETHYWDQVGNIEVPTLILWGKHDVTTPLAFAHAFNAAISQSQLIIYPNAAHLPMEEMPQDVARDIDLWMGQFFP